MLDLLDSCVALRFTSARSPHTLSAETAGGRAPRALFSLRDQDSFVNFGPFITAADPSCEGGLPTENVGGTTLRALFFEPK